MASLVAGELIKNAPEIKAQAESLAREIAREFGLTSEADFIGLYELLLLTYVTVYPTAHNLNVLIKQVQLYLEGLGSDVKTAEKETQDFFRGIPHITWPGLKGF